MNLRQLRYFVTAVDSGNITRAAKLLHVSQPALGLHIRALEDELGVALLHRHSRGVQPTPAGILLHRRANLIFNQLDEARRDVVGLHHATRSPLALGLPTSLTLLIGADVQLVAGRDYDRIALSLVEGPSYFLADAIEREEIDVALAYEVEPRPKLALKAVMEEEILFVSAPLPNAVGETVSMAEVLESRLALGTRRDIGRRILAMAAGLPAEELKVAYEVQSIAAIRDLILRGEACSVMPYGTVARELESGCVIARRILGCPLKSTLYVVRRAAHMDAQPSVSSEALERFIAVAVDMVVEKMGIYGARI